MWSDSWASEGRDQQVPGALARTRSYVLAIACAVVLVGELSVGAWTTALELGRRPSSLPRGLVALGLALVGPYGALLMWRSRRERASSAPSRLRRTAFLGIVLGLPAIGGLVLLLLTLPLLPFVPGIHAGMRLPH